MIKRIHILGASGSGTTTLARELSQKINYKHFDTDNFFWVDTLVPFQEKRKVSDRIDLLKTALEHNEKWILSGSLCGCALHSQRRFFEILKITVHKLVNHAIYKFYR